MWPYVLQMPRCVCVRMRMCMHACMYAHVHMHECTHAHLLLKQKVHIRKNIGKSEWHVGRVPVCAWSVQDLQKPGSQGWGIEEIGVHSLAALVQVGSILPSWGFDGGCWVLRQAGKDKSNWKTKRSILERMEDQSDVEDSYKQILLTFPG